MIFYGAISLLLLGITSAQRPAGTSICDYSAAKILGNNTAVSQKLLITLLVNSFVIGNYTTPNVGVSVAGFAAPNTYNGISINLLPLFTGALDSTNEGGDEGASKLFLDDGGAAPLAKNLSSNGNVTSAQYHLLNHIYEYFGVLLGCSLQGSAEFPSYQGRTSMYEIHRFMDLDKFQMGFFILQVMLSAEALGFDHEDTDMFINTLNSMFNTRCQRAIAITGIYATPELQSICIADNCPLDPHQNCSAYPNFGIATYPANATLNTSPTTSETSTVPTCSTNSGIRTKGGKGEYFATVIGCVILCLMG